MDERNDYNSMPRQPTQTALEWLFLMLNNPNRDQEFANKLFEQAKQMEFDIRKEDFKIGYNQGYLDAQCNHINDADNFANEQEYLNDTNNTRRS